MKDDDPFPMKKYKMDSLFSIRFKFFKTQYVSCRQWFCHSGLCQVEQLHRHFYVKKCISIWIYLNVYDLWRRYNNKLCKKNWNGESIQVVALVYYLYVIMHYIQLFMMTSEPNRDDKVMTFINYALLHHDQNADISVMLRVHFIISLIHNKCPTKY